MQDLKILRESKREEQKIILKTNLGYKQCWRR